MKCALEKVRFGFETEDFELERVFPQVGAREKRGFARDLE